jgi:hypothetical protein
LVHGAWGIDLSVSLEMALSQQLCQQQLRQTSLASQVLTITLYVELPHALTLAQSVKHDWMVVSRPGTKVPSD